MIDIVARLDTLIRYGRDQGMKMNDVEDAKREIERLRKTIKRNLAEIDQWRMIVVNLESQIDSAALLSQEVDRG